MSWSDIRWEGLIPIALGLIVLYVLPTGPGRVWIDFIVWAIMTFNALCLMSDLWHGLLDWINTRDGDQYDD